MRRPVIALVSGLALAVAACAQDAVVADHHVKAAFIYNFTKFVTWPSSAFSTPDQPIRLGIVGEDPLANALRVVEGREAQGRKVEVRRLAPGESFAGCHLVYVGASVMSRAGEILSRLGTAPTLTIGDSPQFTPRGGVINFVLDGDRVRVEICVDRAEQRGLKVSSKLLSLARVLTCERK